MTELQKKLDAKWLEFIELGRLHGFIIHNYEGSALIATHEIQQSTRSEYEYILGQITNGICPIELGYKHCHIEKCNNCKLY